MPEQPPAQLVAMLERLSLATPKEVVRMGRRVRRLTRDLPRFESVWVDALAQARTLTPFQAAEINAGRAELLRVGPYVLCERLPQPHYVACYRARNIETREEVRLAVVEEPGPRADMILRQLESLAPVIHAGADAGRVFAAAPWVEGRTAAQWMVHHGRFPPEIVLEIARAMLAGLVELESRSICHGDVSTSSLILTDEGGVVLLLPGLRGILRPEEGYVSADLLPEAYDSLAPERVGAGTPPNVQSDIYACGCVWWHLLCGRPPLGGGSSLEKVRAAQQGDVCDVRRYAPDVSAGLAAAIGACLEREPSRRPESMARLAAMLGPPTRAGREALADCLARAGRPTVRWTTTVRRVRKSSHTPLWIAGAVCCAAMAVAVLWPAWHDRSATSTAVAKAEGGAPKAEGGGRRAERNGGGRRVESETRVLKQSASSDPISGAVVAASYQQIEAKPPDLLLSAGKPLAASSLDLRAGQCVRGAPGKRAIVLATGGGLLIDKENVRFENIDFVWRNLANNKVTTAEPAVIQLLAGRAEFRGCSFRCEESRDVPISAAIHWVHPTPADNRETSLPSGRLRLTDCLLHRVGAGLDCRTAGALAIELTNMLYLGAGPLVRLDHGPQADEPVSIALGQVTLRGGGPLLECLVPRVDGQPGEIAVLATACAFVPDTDVPLIRVTGAEMPERLLHAVRWSGQGSLVAPRVPIIAWRGLDGRQQAIDESSLSIAGLVRSEVGFAGPPSGDPAASRLIRWQAPLQSADPPGVNPEGLGIRD